MVMLNKKADCGLMNKFNNLDLITKYKVTKLTPNDDYHYFFGYYDLMPYNKDYPYHLTHRVKFADRLPDVDDVCEIGYLKENQFVKIGETTAWNFQQGAFLNWFDSESVIFNCFENGKIISIIKKLDGTIVRKLSMPIASLSNNRKYALSVDFGRIFCFRPGYGYKGVVTDKVNETAPKDDGIFLVDLTTNETKLILSYEQIKSQFNETPFTNDRLVVNHITFNPSGNRYIALVRNITKGNGTWGTLLITGDLNGNVKKLTNFEINSHYNWKNDEEFIIYSILNDGAGLYTFNIVTGQRLKINNNEINKEDIHCLYNSNFEKILGDTYPDDNGYRSIIEYSFKINKIETLLKVKSPKPNCVDIRCDLHARYKDIKTISFDSFHEKYRGIYEVRLNK